MKCLSTFICCGWAHGWNLKLLCLWRWGKVEPNDVVVSWLRLQEVPNCIPHPYWRYMKCLNLHMLWLGLWIQPYCNTCAGGVTWSQMMLWCHGWGCKRSQTASHIHIGGIWCVWAHSYTLDGHMGAPLHCNTCSGGWSVIFWKNGVVRLHQMILWNHGWGWEPPLTASHIHIGCIWSVLAPWYAVNGRMGLLSSIRWSGGVDFIR